MSSSDLERISFAPHQEKKKVKIKKPEDYKPEDFAQKNQEKIPFAYKLSKSMHARKTIGLTNKFVHEGEFQEEQNIVCDADEIAKSVHSKK